MNAAVLPRQPHATTATAAPATTPLTTRKKILQISFSYPGVYADFEPALPGFVQALRDVPGLEWKLWTYNDIARTGAGLYLFSSEEQAADYLALILPQMRGLVRDVRAQVLDIHVPSTLATRGPIHLAA